MTTPVIFRKDEQEVIAVFPAEPGTLELSTLWCYTHVGQHSACTSGWYRTTQPATPDEYKDLLEELISIGYDDLKIVKRITPDMTRERYKRILELKGL